MHPITIVTLLLNSVSVKFLKKKDNKVHSLYECDFFGKIGIKYVISASSGSGSGNVHIYITALDILE